MKALLPGDTVTVTKLDRLARSSRDLHNIIHELDELGCGFARFVRWRRAGVWDRIMDALTAGHDAADIRVTSHSGYTGLTDSVF